MQQLLLPLFPLNLVLFPRTPQPLHIFEDRYKEMIGEALAGKSEFGIVLAQDNKIAGIGCTAVVEKVAHRYDDGRLDILTGGRRRFRLERLDEERAFLRGEVEFFDDHEDASAAAIPAELRARVLAAFTDLINLGFGNTDWQADLDDSQVSFQIAQAVPDLDFRQTLLNSRSELDRMKKLAEFLPAFTGRERMIQHVKTVAPTNGHGRRHVEPTPE